MNLPSLLRSVGPKTRVVAALVVATAIGAALFDWNWFRPWLEHYLADRSHREVVIGDLQISIGLSLEPTVELRDVRIANAAWADTRKPMMVARRVSFTFAWRSLFENRPIVTRLVLIDADVDLQRLADGSRNWRLRRPDDRGPGRFKVMTLETYRSKIRFVHRGIGLDLRMAARPLASPQRITENQQTLDNQIDLSGTWRGSAFEGQAEAPAAMTILETGRAFPLRGKVSAGATQGSFAGTFADLLRLSAADAHLQLKGPSLAALGAFLPVGLPASRPYSVQARVRKDLDNYSATDLIGHIGGSDLSGEFSYRRRGGRPSLQAVLQSDRADPADLGLAGTSPPGGQAGAATQDGPADAKRLFSRHELSSGSLRQLDAQIQLRVKALQLPGLPVLQDLRLTTTLDDGMLSVKPAQFKVAAGQASGALLVNTRTTPPTAELEFSGRHLRLDQLLTSLPPNSRVTGPVSLQLKLAGRGRSIATLMAHASGSLSVEMKDGSIADVLDAKLGLSGGKLLRASLGEPKQIPIHCGAISLAFRNGIGTTQALVLDTARTHLEGEGRIDLREEAFWLLLDPRPEKMALLALPQWIRVDGSFTSARVSLVEPMGTAAGTGCRGAGRIQ